MAPQLAEPLVLLSAASRSLLTRGLLLVSSLTGSFSVQPKLTCSHPGSWSSWCTQCALPC